MRVYTLNVSPMGAPSDATSPVVRPRPVTRPHVWVGGVCRRCAIRSTWAGARGGCEGIGQRESESAKATKREANRRHRERKRALRALGVIR